MSTNRSSKPGSENVIKFNVPFDSSRVLDSPGYKNMVASINAATKFSEQHAALIAATEKQLEPARQMVTIAAAVNADPMLKAFDSTFKLVENQKRLLVDLDGIQSAMKALSPESIGLPPGWDDLLSAVSKSTFDDRFFSDLLAHATELENEVEAAHVEQTVQEFFENQPELADSIDHLPIVQATVNQEDREKIVTFIRVLIFTSAFCLILGVTPINPWIPAILSAAGLGALDAYKKSDAPVRRLVDKIADDPDGGEIKDPLWEE
ncbi:hypothetical protein [Arthrobacter sp. G119Y2]|uniref:hypothetical protein n=1 Tax=Arthrobacter sp. G119Y2 TaxID=3134965 RepID=UPI003119F13C